MEKLAADMMKVLSGFTFGILAWYWSENGFSAKVFIGILCAVDCYIVGKFFEKMGNEY